MFLADIWITKARTISDTPIIILLIPVFQSRELSIEKIFSNTVIRSSIIRCNKHILI